MNEDIKRQILNQSYVGKKGYTIFKDNLPNSTFKKIKDELFLKPFVPGKSFGKAESVGFPVYRENEKKLYVPRFYGIEKFGLPNKTILDSGEDIDVPFVKELRDYQENIVGKYINHVIHQEQGGGILEVPCGRGKCLGKNTPVLMYDGTIKNVQDICVGDLIMGDDSKPRKILTLARGREQMYKVVPKKGDSYIVNESHILSLKYSSKVNNYTPKGSVIDMPLKDYLNLPKSYHGKGGVLLGYRVPITFPKKAIDIDPYLLGYWLGDGSSNGTKFSTQESNVLVHINKECLKNHPDLYISYTGYQYDYSIISVKKGKECNSFLNGLKKYNLLKNKHIPYDYKCNERSIQLKLLAGIIDSDGSKNANCYDIIQKNETLIDDIIYLCRSLGFAAYKKKCEKSCIYKGEIKKGIYYRTNIHGYGLDEIPVKCIRKICEKRKQIKDVLNTRIKIEKLEVDDYYGFEIDGNRRFVLGDFTVTHNTIMALKIISLLKKKVLILVHKEFLMNQWIERIEEFLPTARIGKIQAGTCDTFEKEIVIGMIQTMYSKVFPPEVYSQFGLTIIDEVHRIGSEEFSKTLLRTITPYMLGISATVERKDKLTNLLYMFIGPKIYSEERSNDDLVCVRGIEFKTNDEEFKIVETDFRGQTKYSTMISKLCDYGPRSDFIVRVVKDLIAENDEAQIMILAHNKNLLKYLHDSIIDRKIASAGYYVGGMKQKDLQETETKQVVIATYAMAAEALDIKTLSTLIMATPKTDITQSVGRILRMKHDNPIVVDIIDSHDCFQNQWKQRKRFYKKSGYRIRNIDSPKYTNMSIDWNKDKSWLWTYEPNQNSQNNEKNNDNDNEMECMINFFKLKN